MRIIFHPLSLFILGTEEKIMIVSDTKKILLIH